MNSNVIYNRASGLIGNYLVAEGAEHSAELERLTRDYINIILYDLGSPSTIKELGDEIVATDEVLQALPFGVAMLLCVAVGEGTRQGFFAGIYESRRAKIKSGISSKKDVLPRQVSI